MNQIFGGEYRRPAVSFLAGKQINAGLIHDAEQKLPLAPRPSLAILKVHLPQPSIVVLKTNSRCSSFLQQDGCHKGLCLVNRTGLGNRPLSNRRERYSILTLPAGLYTELQSALTKSEMPPSHQGTAI